MLCSPPLSHPEPVPHCDGAGGSVLPHLPPGHQREAIPAGLAPAGGEHAPATEGAYEPPTPTADLERLAAGTCLLPGMAAGRACGTCPGLLPCLGAVDILWQWDVPLVWMRVERWAVLGTHLPHQGGCTLLSGHLCHDRIGLGRCQSSLPPVCMG